MVSNAQFGGRLGNQMFYYAFSYLLAKQLGYRLVAQPIQYFDNTFAPLGGKEIEKPLTLIGNSRKSMAEIVERCRGRRVVTHGAFERTEYYLPFKEEVQWLFKFDRRKPGSLGISFHFRGDDFKGQQKYVDARFYIRSWKLIGSPKQFNVFTDDLNDPEMLKFLNVCGLGHLIPKQLGNEWNDFAQLAASEIMVIPRSTFSWWAAFLSDAIVLQAAPIKDEFEWRSLANPEWCQYPVADYFPSK